METCLVILQWSLVALMKIPLSRGGKTRRIKVKSQFDQDIMTKHPFDKKRDLRQMRLILPAGTVNAIIGT